jgi:glutathione S-transferase
MHGGFARLRARCTMNVGLRISLHDKGDDLGRDVARIAALWAEGFRQFGGPFLAGPAFTAVDAMFAPVAFRAQTYGILDDEAASGYVQRLLALAPMHQWEVAALAETAREPGHEEEARATGALVADLRAMA